MALPRYKIGDVKGILQILHLQKKCTNWERGAMVGMQKIQIIEKIKILNKYLHAAQLFS